MELLNNIISGSGRNIVLIVLCAVIGFFILEAGVRQLSTRRKKKKEKTAHDNIYIDGAEVLYSDSDEAYLMTYRYGRFLLQGKPDFVLKNTNNEVYVKDLKSGKSPGYVKREYRMQLAAYFLLVKEDLGKEVKYGIIHYQEDRKQVRLNNTPGLILELTEKMKVLGEAKADIDSYLKQAARNHNEPGTCRFCEFKETCPKVLK